MHSPAVIKVEIELDPGSDPIEGRLCPAGASPEAFVGWIELAAALERLRVAASGPV